MKHLKAAEYLAAQVSLNDATQIQFMRCPRHHCCAVQYWAGLIGGDDLILEPPEVPYDVTLDGIGSRFKYRSQPLRPAGAIDHGGEPGNCPSGFTLKGFWPLLLPNAPENAGEIGLYCIF